MHATGSLHTDMNPCVRVYLCHWGVSSVGVSGSRPRIAGVGRPAAGSCCQATVYPMRAGWFTVLNETDRNTWFLRGELCCESRSVCLHVHVRVLGAEHSSPCCRGPVYAARAQAPALQAATTELVGTHLGAGWVV
jgi:hypothetical protein